MQNCTRNSSLILTGDFNDRTNSWHSSHSDSELGLDLYNLLNSFSLTPIIEESTRNQNLLDLIITSNPRLIVNSGVLDPIDNLIIVLSSEYATFLLNTVENLSGKSGITV